MPLTTEFRDLLCAFNEAGAEYLLVGGYAYAFHVEPRYTKDIDLWVRPCPANAVRVAAVLRAFGVDPSDYSAEDLAISGPTPQIGSVPDRVDIMTAFRGVAFDGAWDRQAAMTSCGQLCRIIGKQDLIANKRAVGRPQDLLDLAKLLEPDLPDPPVVDESEA